MWIVRLALRRPYTFVVMALVIILLGIITIGRMPTDISPEINIPVVSVIWTFAGMSPEDIEKRIVTISERAMTTTVNDIEHMESQSMQGVSVIKVFFSPRHQDRSRCGPDHVDHADYSPCHAARYSTAFNPPL